MTAEKRSEQSPARTASPTTPTTITAGVKGQRKAWVRRSNVDVVLAALTKQERRLAALEAELALEKRELEKLSAAKKLLEAK